MLKCCDCDKELSKDEIGVNRKMLARDIKEFFCLDCLAEYLDTTPDELLIKIEEFKEQGCTLFG